MISADLPIHQQQTLRGKRITPSSLSSRAKPRDLQCALTRNKRPLAASLGRPGKLFRTNRALGLRLARLTA